MHLGAPIELLVPCGASLGLKRPIKRAQSCGPYRLRYQLSSSIQESLHFANRLPYSVHLRAIATADKSNHGWAAGVLVPASFSTPCHAIDWIRHPFANMLHGRHSLLNHSSLICNVTSKKNGDDLQTSQIQISSSHELRSSRHFIKSKCQLVAGVQMSIVMHDVLAQCFSEPQPPWRPLCPLP